MENKTKNKLIILGAVVLGLLVLMVGCNMYATAQQHRSEEMFDRSIDKLNEIDDEE